MNRQYDFDLQTQSAYPIEGITESDIEEMAKIARTILAKDAGLVVVWDEEFS